MIIKIQLFLYNNVDFTRKCVPLYSNIRLLERDEWILLDRNHVAKRLITFKDYLL